MNRYLILIFPLFLSCGVIFSQNAELKTTKSYFEVVTIFSGKIHEVLDSVFNNLIVIRLEDDILPVTIEIEKDKDTLTLDLTNKTQVESIGLLMNTDKITFVLGNNFSFQKLPKIILYDAEGGKYELDFVDALGTRVKIE